MDGWRGFLAVLVMFAHANQIFISPMVGVHNYNGWFFSALAHVAVLGFFTISGVAITMSIVININRNDQDLNFRQYIIARVARIYPPLLFSILLCFLFYAVIYGFDLLGGVDSYRLPGDLFVARDFFAFEFKDVLKTLGFERGGMVKVNGPLWSLIIEWWIYFLALFFTGMFFSKNKYVKIVSLFLFLLILNKIVRINGLVYLAIWLLGSIFFLVKNHKKWMVNLLFIGSLTGLVVSNFFLKFYEDRTDITLLPMVQLLIGLLFFSIVLLFPVKSIFNKISNYSYSIYIMHYPIFLFIFSLFHKVTNGLLVINIVLALVAVVVVFVVAANSWSIIENKKYFAQKFNNALQFIHHKLTLIKA